MVVAKCLTCLLFTRASMGNTPFPTPVGKGVLFPCMHQIASAWYPVQQRSSLVTLVASGSDLATISALIISPAIMAASGWQRIFVVFSAFSFFWVVMYVHEGAGQPGDDPRITVEERTSILRNRIANPGTTHQTLRRAGRSSNWTFAELSIHTLHTLNWRVLVTSGPRRRSMLRTCATITVGSSCWTGFRSMLAKA